jgi:DNA-directed RNA polymerase alpha subunit
MSKSDLMFLLSKLPSHDNLWERITKAVMNALTKEELSEIVTTLISENGDTLLAVLEADPDRLESLYLSTRAKNALEAEGVCSVSELTSRTRAEVGRFINLGKGCLKEIETALARRNLQLKV